MPVDAVNAQVASLISGARLKTQQKINEREEDDEVKKEADKKRRIKEDHVKKSTQQRHAFQRNQKVNARLQQILGGAAGREAANSLSQWNNNQQLQSRLTEAQKNLFRQTMANNPKQGAKAGEAMNRLTQSPGFQRAGNNSQQMGALQEAVVNQPRTEQAASQMLQSRFMQSGRADGKAKTDFLRFGMNQAQKGQLGTVKRAGDMLGSLTQAKTPRNAQRAAMRMVQRNSANTAGMDNLDGFVRNPNVAKMPSFARGKATELLAKADGRAEVREGFEKLASDARFRGQTAQNKGRFFSTIGTGRPSEYRAITDKTLQALQSQNFPTRSAQVSRFLGKLGGQIQKGGARAMDTAGAMRQAKASTRPAPPQLESTAGLDEDDAARVRSRNRAKVMQYFTQLQRAYDQHAKKRQAATCFEDVNSLPKLHAPEDLDLSSLGPQEREFAEWVKQRQGELAKQRDAELQAQKQRARELRTKRRPPSKRRARAANPRVQGRQSRYFTPARQGGAAAVREAFTQPQSQSEAASPARSKAAGGRRAVAARQGQGGELHNSIQSQVSRAVSQLGSGPVSAEQAGQVAHTIANQVAQQVAQQVMQQLTGKGASQQSGQEPAADPPAEEQAPKRSAANDGSTRAAGVARTDGWGVPRALDRDLSGPRAPVQPPSTQEDADWAAFDEAQEAPYTGRKLIKDDSTIRTLSEMWDATWVSLPRPEQTLLKNLGWTQQLWDTKDAQAGRLPGAMGTAFRRLTPVQQEAVRKLGFTQQGWDEAVEALGGEFQRVTPGKSGRNA